MHRPLRLIERKVKSFSIPLKSFSPPLHYDFSLCIISIKGTKMMVTKEMYDKELQGQYGQFRFLVSMHIPAALTPYFRSGLTPWFRFTDPQDVNNIPGHCPPKMLITFRFIDPPFVEVVPVLILVLNLLAKSQLDEA